LEFLGLLPSDSAEAEMVGESVGLSEVERIMPAQPVTREDELLALFMKKHEAYLHRKELEIKRLRQEIQAIRKSRREIESLILRQVLSRSG
jgi:hypothetical protein